MAKNKRNRKGPRVGGLRGLLERVSGARLCYGEPVTAGACHCRDCQYLSGGGPAHVLVMAAGDVKMTKGEPRIYFSLSEAGHTVGRSFCEDCGTPVFAQNAARPGILDELCMLCRGPMRPSSAPTNSHACAP